MIKRNIAIAVAGMALVGCTSTNSNPPTLAEPATLLTADEIRNVVLDQTVEGVATVPRVGRVPFKLFFSGAENRYSDRVVVNGNVQRAMGSFEIRPTGELCRNSRSRNGGNRTCWQVERQGTKYRFIDVSSVGQLKPAIVTLSPGLNF